jgi:hypothetical protein
MGDESRHYNGSRGLREIEGRRTAVIDPRLAL